MNRLPISRSFASALDGIDVTQLFNPVVRGQYANNVVFSAPVNREDLMLRAIEALRSSSLQEDAMPLVHIKISDIVHA